MVKYCASVIELWSAYRVYRLASARQMAYSKNRLVTGMIGRTKDLRAILGALALSVLTSCAGSPLGDNVQQSLEADPQLEESPPFQTSVEEGTVDSQTVTDANLAETPERNSGPASSEIGASGPEPGDFTFIGPIPPKSGEMQSPGSNDNTANGNTQVDTSDLAGIPIDLQSYIRDLQEIEVLSLSTSLQTTESQPESPFGQTITRREYARWLFDSYNTIYADEPGERLRPGNPDDEPAFQDVSAANPDYEVIQGLAEAGIIPSAFTGNSTAVNFQPDAPLVREDLILWKVPLDTQTVLPTSTPEAVTQAWGFQDTASIDPLALRAIAADYQLGDFSNVRRAFGYTTLFRPDKAVSRAEAAAVLWRFGTQTEGRTAAEVAPMPPQARN